MILKKSKSCKIRNYLIKDKNLNIFQKSNSDLSVICLSNKKILLQQQIFFNDNLLNSDHLEFTNKKKNKTRKIFDLISHLKKKKEKRKRKRNYNC